MKERKGREPHVLLSGRQKQVNTAFRLFLLSFLYFSDFLKLPPKRGMEESAVLITSLVHKSCLIKKKKRDVKKCVLIFCLSN